MGGAASAPWAWLALAWIIASTLTARFSFREMGLTRLTPALWVTGAGLLLAAGNFAGGALAGTLHVYSNQSQPALGGMFYLAWSLGQEFILHSFFFLRLERVRGGKRAVWAAGVLFFCRSCA